MRYYPNLDYFTDEELVMLLAAYIDVPNYIREADADFIKAIQDRLKQVKK